MKFSELTAIRLIARLTGLRLEGLGRFIVIALNKANAAYNLKVHNSKLNHQAQASGKLELQKLLCGMELF